MKGRLDLLYIIGVPGSGKSTLAAALVLGRRRRVLPHPFAHTVYEDGLVQLGRERGGGFSGTDALSMSVQPHVLGVLATGHWPRVLGEGDRLANAAFFDRAEALGYTVEVVLLDVPEKLAAGRRAKRGSNQDETWLKGRRSKVENLRERATVILNGTLPLDEQVRMLADHVVIRRP